MALGSLSIAIVLWDVFEFIVLPRRMQSSLRLAQYFLRGLWAAWSTATRSVRNSAARENVLGVFGPLSLILLILAWATLLVLAYALLYWGAGGVGSNLGSDVYFSGTTFFTLGLGDVAPHGWGTRVIAMVEVANGFLFLALVISYLPVFYQSFSRRETNISLLDARAGSPPTAGELLHRYTEDHAADSLRTLLFESERWAAELLESHLSYPILMFYRSQHERQSWVAALTVVLDASAVIMCRGSGATEHAARLTFAMARHAAVDLSGILARSPRGPDSDRLPAAEFKRLDAILAASPQLTDSPEWGSRLAELRHTYEPYVASLSRYLAMPLPAWLGEDGTRDDWETSEA